MNNPPNAGNNPDALPRNYGTMLLNFCMGSLFLLGGLGIAFTLICSVLTDIVFEQELTIEGVKCRHAWEEYSKFSTQHYLNERMTYQMKYRADEFEQLMTRMVDSTVAKRFDTLRHQFKEDCTDAYFGYSPKKECAEEVHYYEELLEMVPLHRFNNNRTIQWPKTLGGYPNFILCLHAQFILSRSLLGCYSFAKNLYYSESFSPVVRWYKNPAFGYSKSFRQVEHDELKPKVKTTFGVYSSHWTIPAFGQLIHSKARVDFRDTAEGCHVTEWIMTQAPKVFIKKARKEVETQRSKVMRRFKYWLQEDYIDKEFYLPQPQRKDVPSYYDELTFYNRFYYEASSWLLNNEGYETE